jgi:hypothetical protein
VGIRERLRHLEAAAEAELIVIPQRDGTVARFRQSEGIEAYVNWFDRMGAGEDAPPEHPLLMAARNSSDPYWSQGIYAVNDPDEWVKPIEDLSEELLQKQPHGVMSL